MQFVYNMNMRVIAHYKYMYMALFTSDMFVHTMYVSWYMYM